MTFLTIFRIMEILCSFRLVLEEKAGKGIPGSSRLQLPDKLLANNFALADADNNNYKPLNRGGIVDLPLLRTLLAIPKSPKRATILKSDGIFCFCSIYKFGSFKNPSVMTTSLPELYFRSRRFILLVQKKKKIIWTIAAVQAAVRFDLILMMRDTYIYSNLNSLTKFTRNRRSTEFDSLDITDIQHFFDVN